MSTSSSSTRPRPPSRGSSASGFRTSGLPTVRSSPSRATTRWSSTRPRRADGCCRRAAAVTTRRCRSSRRTAAGPRSTPMPVRTIGRTSTSPSSARAIRRISASGSPSVLVAGQPPARLLGPLPASSRSGATAPRVGSPSPASECHAQRRLDPVRVLRPGLARRGPLRRHAGRPAPRRLLGSQCQVIEDPCKAGDSRAEQVAGRPRRDVCSADSEATR